MKLYDFAKSNESHELIAKILILQAKLALINLETNEAVYLLQQAKDIASNFNLEFIRLQISFLDSQVQNSLYEFSSDLYDKIETPEFISKQIEDYEIMDYLKNLYYQQEANELLKTDIDNIRKYNIDLAKLIKVDDFSLNLDNLSRIVDMSSREISLMYNTLKHLDRLEKGTMYSELLETDILLILEDVLEIYKSTFSNQNIGLAVSLPDDPVVLKIDSFLIQLCIEHVLFNALKYAIPDTTFSVDLSSTGEEAMLSFSNFCLPIPAEIHDKLPEKYFQYHRDKSMLSGYGVGLTYIFKIIEFLHSNVAIIISNGDDQEQSRFEITFTFSLDKSCTELM